MKKTNVKDLQILANLKTNYRYEIVSACRLNGHTQLQVHDRKTNTTRSRRADNFKRACGITSENDSETESISTLNTDPKIGEIISGPFHCPYMVINGKHYLRYATVYGYLKVCNSSLKNLLKSKGLIKFNRHELSDETRDILMPHANTSIITVVCVKNLYYGLKRLLKTDYQYNKSRVKYLMTVLISNYQDEIKPTGKYKEIINRNEDLVKQVHSLRRKLGGTKGNHTWYKNQLEIARDRISELETKRQPWYKRIFSLVLN